MSAPPVLRGRFRKTDAISSPSEHDSVAGDHHVDANDTTNIEEREEAEGLARSG